MKVMRLVIAAFAVVVATSSVAKADLVLVGGSPAASFTDLGGTGFGAAPRLLTLQDNTSESGFETPIDVENGGAIDGANKSTTPTVASLGWTSGAQVGIGFNSNQTGGSGITMQSLTLTLYNGTSAVGSFSTAGPIDFSATVLALQQGNGNAVFNFGLNAAQQTQFNTLLGTYGSGLYAGVGSTLGCPAGSPAGCMPSNDGADSFLGFAQSGGTPVPDGGMTVMLLGGALFGLETLRRRFRA